MNKLMYYKNGEYATNYEEPPLAKKLLTIE